MEYRPTPALHSAMPAGAKVAVHDAAVRRGMLESSTAPLRLHCLASCQRPVCCQAELPALPPLSFLQSAGVARRPPCSRRQQMPHGRHGPLVQRLAAPRLASRSASSSSSSSSRLGKGHPQTNSASSCHYSSSSSSRS